MKILVLATTYPRWKNDHEPAFVHHLAKGLVERGHELIVLAPHTTGSAKQEIIDGVEVKRFQYLPEKWQKLAYEGGIVPKLKRSPFLAWQIPFLLLAMFASAWKTIFKNEIGFVHAHWIIPQGIIACLLRATSRKPFKVMVTSHGADLFAFKQAPFRNLKRLTIRKSDCFTVVSHAMKDYCIENDLAEKEKIIVRSMGVDCEDVFADRIEFKKRSGFVFVGRLTEKKGCDDLLDAFALFLKQFPRETLTIVGDGLDRRALVQQVQSLQIAENVRFVGSVESFQVAEYLNLAKFSIVPSKIASSGDQEGLGLVVVESLSCGCITLVSDLPAIRDVHDCGELQFEAGVPKSLLETMIYAYEHEDRALRLSSDLKEKAQEKFSWKAVVSDYEGFFNSQM